MRFRQHPMALAQPVLITVLIFLVAPAFLFSHLGWVLRTLHITTGSPLLPAVTWFIGLIPLLSIALPIAGGLLILGALSTWAISSYEIAEGNLTYRIIPVSSNSIPLRSIQDLAVNRADGLGLGLLFGYGTLKISAGRTRETLRFVPNVEHIAHLLRTRQGYGTEVRSTRF